MYIIKVNAPPNRHINKSPLRRGHLDLKLELKLVSILGREEVGISPAFIEPHCISRVLENILRHLKELPC